MSVDEYVWKKIGIISSFLIILVGGAIGAASGIYYKNKLDGAEKRIREVNVSSEVDVSALVTKVGKLIKLPEGETPTIATINDIEKLKNQAFFQNAKNGDKIIIYTNAKRAILYDSLANKIINVEQINLGATDSAQTQVSTVTPSSN